MIVKNVKEAMLWIMLAGCYVLFVKTKPALEYGEIQFWKISHFIAPNASKKN